MPRPARAGLRSRPRNRPRGTARGLDGEKPPARYCGIDHAVNNTDHSLPCRRRKRKCGSRPPAPRLSALILANGVAGDGRRPTCRRCEDKRDACVWGMKVSFHPSRMLELSETDTSALAARERQRRGARRTRSSRAADPFVVCPGLSLAVFLVE